MNKRSKKIISVLSIPIIILSQLLYFIVIVQEENLPQVYARGEDWEAVKAGTNSYHVYFEDGTVINMVQSLLDIYNCHDRFDKDKDCNLSIQEMKAIVGLECNGFTVTCSYNGKQLSGKDFGIGEMTIRHCEFKNLVEYICTG